MIGSAMQKAFVRVLVVMILSLEFWLFSLAGLLILGWGPALRMITETYLNHGFKYREYSLKESWHLFKKYFWQANGHFYVFFVVTAFLFYDLYLTSQIKNNWILPIDILLVILLVFIPIIGIYTLHIESYFDIQFINAIKLAISEFFIDFSGLWRFFLGAGLCLVITRFFPGLLLFITIGFLIIWCDFTSKKWLLRIESQL